MSTNIQKKKRVLYSREDLREAMAAVKAGMPILKASAKYKIPRTTLRNKQRAKDIDKKPGPGTVLTADEEEKLVQWIIDCSNIGMPVAKQQLQNSVLLLLKKLDRYQPFTNGRPGHHWYRNFLTRNKKIVKRLFDNMAIAKAAATETGLRNWFANIERYLKEKDLLSIHPSRLFSTETVFIVNPNRNESNESLCIQITGNVAGQLAYPMIVFTEEMVSHELCEAMPPGWTIGKSESASVTAENFYEYIVDCFYPWLVKNNIEFPIVLFVHGRVSHVTLSLTEFCAEHGIELIALHPNSTYLLHPLETLFSPLKTAWQQGIDVYCKNSKSPVLTKEKIAPFLKCTLDTLNIAELLKEGFKSCGLYPLSVESVNFKKIPERLADKPPKERVEFAPYVATVTPKPIKKKSQITSKEFLRMFEERLDPLTLQAFKRTENSDVWKGCEKETALFYYWKNALNQASTSCEINSDSSNSGQNCTDNNIDLSDAEFDDVTSFLEIQSQSEDPIAPADPIKIFIKTNDPD